MHYVVDTKGIRDQKQKVDDARLEIEIANKQKQIDLIQKEIDLLNDKKDAINEQIDLLDEQIEKINEYYDEQIKAIDKQIDAIDKQIEALEKQREQTEKYFEFLIENLEKSKSKYEELTEIVEKAELSAALKQLGIDEEALLNGSEEEFEKLKQAYLDIVYQLNAGNDDVLSALRELSGYDGTAPALLSDSNSELDTMNGKLDESNQSVGNVNSSLGETASTTSEVASNVSDLESNLSTVNGLVSEEQTAFENLKQKIDEVIEAINQKTEAIQEEQNAVGIAASSEMADFLLLKEKILEVKETLESFGTPEEGLISNIASAIESLNNMSLDEGIIAQFNNLKEAIDSVTAAISGGGDSSEGEGSSSGSSGGESGGKGSKGEGSSGNSLTGAINEMGDTANKVIGEPDAEGDGTVIGEFGSMETAVNDVTAAIGGGDSEGGQGSGGEDEGNLIGSIVDLGETTEETLGEPGGDGVIRKFEELEQPIQEADEHVHGISDGLDAIDGKEVECTIKVNIEVSGSTGFTGSAHVLGSMNLNSAEYNAKYTGNAHYEGTAEVTGDWGVKQGGNTLVGELGQELVVFPNGRFKTVGDNGAEFVDIPKGSIVFNHFQTRELLSKGNLVGRGKALANGTALASGAAHTNGTVNNEAPLYPSQETLDFIKRSKQWEMKMDLIANNTYGMLSPLHEIKQNTENMISNISNVSNVTNNNNKNVQQPIVNHISVTLPNVTNSTSAESLLRDLESLNTKKYQVDW